jgi:regulator of protease activity HflC (stomatin/prohibitin superfamily)
MEVVGIFMVELGFWQAFFDSDAWLLMGVGLILGTFDKLMDWIAAGVGHLQFMFVLDPYEAGVVLRVGTYSRTVGPGWHFMAPFGIERVMKDTVVRTTQFLDVQSLTTRDGHHINSSPIVIYKIGNIKRWLLEVDDAEAALHDLTYGLNDALTSETDLADIHEADYAEQLTALVAEEAIDWGGRVLDIKFSDRAASKSLRLWTGGGDTEYE